MNRRARRRLAIVLATAALSAAVGAYKPFDRRAASSAFDRGLEAARGSDLSPAAEAFSECLRLRPGRADCAAALALVRRVVATEDKELQRAKLAERARVEAAAEAAIASGPSDENRLRAVKHWNEGIKAFQKNDYAAAKDEWTLCKRFDPSFTECAQGLTRLDNTYGGGL